MYLHPIINLQAIAVAEYYGREIIMEISSNKIDVTNQIYQMALTYVASHEDVKNMSPDEFCEKVFNAQKEFSSIWGNYRVQ